MPGMDGMGPMGMGPGTGWGRGGCYGYGPYGHPGFYGGWGGGRGRGRGFRWRFWAGGAAPWGWGGYGPAPRGPYPQGAWGGYGPGPWGTPSREEEVGWLKDQAEMLKAEMEAVQRRIDELAAEEQS